MKKLMVKHFYRWARKEKIPVEILAKAIDEVLQGQYEASLGGYLIKKRIAFNNRGKRGSSRTIICYQRGKIAIYLYGFLKNEKSDLTKKELLALKALAKVLVQLSEDDIQTAIEQKELCGIG